MTILTVLAAVSLSAAPIKIAAPNLEGVGLTAELRSFYTSHLAQQLQMRGLTVISAADIQALISQERQKELMGCGDSEACAVELGNALGADALLSGTVAKLGATYQINVKVISGVDGKPLALYSGKAGSDDAVVTELNNAADALAKTLIEKEIPRRPSATEQTKQLFTDSERREGRFIVRNDPVREGGRRLILASLIGIPVGLIGLGLTYPAGIRILEIPSWSVFLVSVVALPVGLIMYFIGKQERVPALSIMVGDRNRIGLVYSGVF